MTYRIILLWCIITVLKSLEWFEEGSPTLLTITDFNFTLKDTSHCKFVKFFTPWCRFCRILKTIIDEHRKTSFEKRTDVKFYDVNCHTSPDICIPLEVYTVPFIILYSRNGSSSVTASGIYPKEWYISFINKNCAPLPFPHVVVQSQDENKQLRKRTNTLNSNVTLVKDQKQLTSKLNTENEKKQVNEGINGIENDMQQQTGTNNLSEQALSQNLPYKVQQDLQEVKEEQLSIIPESTNKQQQLKEEKLRQRQIQNNSTFIAIDIDFTLIIGAVMIVFGAFIVHYKCKRNEQQSRVI